MKKPRKKTVLTGKDTENSVLIASEKKENWKNFHLGYDPNAIVLLNVRNIFCMN